MMCDLLSLVTVSIMMRIIVSMARLLSLIMSSSSTVNVVRVMKSIIYLKEL